MGCCWSRRSAAEYCTVRHRKAYSFSSSRRLSSRGTHAARVRSQSLAPGAKPLQAESPPTAATKMMSLALSNFFRWVAICAAGQVEEMNQTVSIARHLKKLLRANDIIFVAAVGEDSAWGGFAPGASDWLRTRAACVPREDSRRELEKL